MKYHKIQSLFKRDPENNNKTFLEGEFSLPVFEYFWNSYALFYAEEKIDGINMRVIWKNGELTFAGKNDETDFYPGALELLQRYFRKDYFQSTFSTNFVLYGEMYGGNIQKVGPEYGDLKFTIFDHLNLDTGNWMQRETLDEYVWDHFGNTERLDFTYSNDKLTLKQAYELVKMDCCFESNLSKNTDLKMEGFILRPLTELKDNIGRRVITKLKLKDFGHSVL